MQPLNVFVYGTLKKGHGNHRVLGNSLFLGKAVTKEKHILTDCGFPYMVPDSDGELVSGELYCVDDPAVLEGLDRLEGVRYGHYEHHEVEVKINPFHGWIKATSYIPVNIQEAFSYPACKTNENGEYEWGI